MKGRYIMLGALVLIGAVWYLGWSGKAAYDQCVAAGNSHDECFIATM